MTEVSDLGEQKQSRIPKFASMEEEAEFWDTHDITDFLDELKPTTLEFSGNLAQGLVVRFDSDIFKRVCGIAHNKGVTPDALVHQWVVERLSEQ